MGPLRVAANNYGICFISGGVNGRDICVPSFEMRNRAMDGDVVVVEKLPRALWKINEKEAAKLGINVYREDQEPVLSTSASLVDVEQFLARLTLEPRELFVEPTGTTIVALSSFADLDHLLAKAAALAGPIFERKQQTKNPLDLPDTVVQTSGKVVFIKEALHPRIALGTLERTATMLRFVTRDRRFPRTI